MNETLQRQLVDRGAVLLDGALPRSVTFGELEELKAERRREWTQRLAQLRRLGVPTAVAPSAGFSVTATASAQSTSAKTSIGAAAGANKGLTVAAIEVSSSGTSGNLLVELVFGTNATNAPGTNSTSFTALQIRGGTETFEGSAAINWTSEPTVLVVQKVWRLPLPTGPFVLLYPLGRELTGTPTAATSGKFVGLRLTASAGTPNADLNLELEE